MRILGIAFLLLLALSGCGFGRYMILDPERDRVMRVESGDRFYFTLEEKDVKGGKWSAKTDDSDVEVSVEHTDDGEAKVILRIHRGYDGPSVVTFRKRRPGKSRSEKEFRMNLYRHTGDSAFWE